MTLDQMKRLLKLCQDFSYREINFDLFEDMLTTIKQNKDIKTEILVLLILHRGFGSISNGLKDRITQIEKATTP